MPTYRLPVRLQAPVAGQCVNVWHIRTVTTPLLSSELQAAVNAIRGFYTSLVTLIPSGTAISADFALNNVDNTDQVVSWAALNATGTGNLLPPHLAVCLTWKTSQRTRRARGRTFLGPLVVGTNDSTGTPAQTNLDQITAAANTLISASTAGNGWAIGVWGLVDPAPKGQTKGLNLLPHMHRDITGVTIRDQFAVLRSRRPR